MYGCFVVDDHDRFMTWINREKGTDAKKKMRHEFALSNCLLHLENRDPDTARIARSLYDQCIDYGAHPNPQSILTQLSTGKELGLYYQVGGDSPPFQLALKTCKQVGVCSLLICRLAQPDFVHRAVVSETIDELKAGL